MDRDNTRALKLINKMVVCIVRWLPQSMKNTGRVIGSLHADGAKFIADVLKYNESALGDWGDNKNNDFPGFDDASCLYIAALSSRLVYYIKLEYPHEDGIQESRVYKLDDSGDDDYGEFPSFLPKN